MARRCSFDTSIYINTIDKDEKLSNKQKKCMTEIINTFDHILFCIISENVIFCIGTSIFNNPFHRIYVVNDEYFIKKYWDPNGANYDFITNHNDFLFSIMLLKIHKYQNDNHELCNNLLIKYSENENIIPLFSNNKCDDEKIFDTIKKNIINELMDANIIIDYDTRDKIADLFSGDADNILNHIFGFIPKATQFSFID